jgi:protein-S-isoprenylcysteine O-methyltransferase Ste14
MPLREEFERTGNWLFRWRSYLPIVLAACLLAAAIQSGRASDRERFRAAWLTLCGGVSLMGLATRALVVGHTPRRTSGRSTSRQVAYQLNTTGMYSIVRHPLYLGNFLIWLGLALAVRSPWLVVLFGLAFWLYYERIMFAEEEFLRRQFGAAYTDWAAGTPAFWPRVRQWRSAALPFSPRNVLKREYTAACGIVLGLAGIEGTRQWSGAGRPVLDFGWLVAVVAAVGMALALRTLKKHTRWLKVEGR